MLGSRKGLSREQVLEVLRDVQDPELHRSIVELDMVRDVQIRGGVVRVEALLTIGGCPLRETIVQSIEQRLRQLPGVERVEVHLGVMTPEQRQALIQKLRPPQGPDRPPSFLRPESGVRVLAVASGKGGVGKSTVTANLAAALALRGLRVGVLDADVYGFSIPKMLGIQGRPTVIDQMILPMERDGVRAISMGMLVEANEAVIWRGPMLHKALATFIQEVHWGDLEVLLLDLPPGTGDVSISIAQLLPWGEMVIVTTPQEAAVEVAQRAARMAEKVGMRVAGVIENMSYYQPHPEAEPLYLFGKGGGRMLAERLGTELLAEIPLDPRVREGSDRGEPIVRAHPDSTAAQAFFRAADRILARSRVLR
ncbi:MAG: Mrp/NBP35 family ATP-binding protein [Armatimonadetes bacterium]|nr:Mrp/NBP35 family ATP-binding protein [Armatimonadota bacterium]MDW8153375.1 Mrp/NBP35 family ATP-binding protein [Armatimonadota bacterium]